METFEKKLEQLEDDLLHLSRRLYALEAFLAELERVTKGKPFKIRNDIVWMMVLDLRDAFVIHFASWAKGLYQRGGFFGQIQAHHLRAFRSKPAGIQVRDEDQLREAEEGHRKDFEWLFPRCTAQYPSCDDMCALKDRFAVELEPVVNDRNANRAHPYEKRNAASASMLDLKVLREKVTGASDFLNRMRRVTSFASLHYQDMNEVSAMEVAEDLVDALLFGPSQPHSPIGLREERASRYERLHRHHDGLDDDPKSYFNDLDLDDNAEEI